MFRKSALAGVACALAASTAQAVEWQPMDWNNQTIWAAPWTEDTALPFHTVGQWYVIYFDGWSSNYGAGNASTPLPGLHASLFLRLSEIDDDEWTFDYVIENESNNENGNLVTGSQISRIGFDIVDKDDRLRDVDAGWSSVFEDTYLDVDEINPPGPANSYYRSTFRLLDDNDNGPRLGQTRSGSFTLDFWGSDSPGEISFSDPYLQYTDITWQQPTAQIATFGGGHHHHSHYPGCGHHDWNKPKKGVGEGIPVAWVPEPSTWAMMILGFGAVGWQVRAGRRRLAAA